MNPAFPSGEHARGHGGEQLSNTFAVFDLFIRLDSSSGSMPVVTVKGGPVK